MDCEKKKREGLPKLVSVLAVLVPIVAVLLWYYLSQGFKGGYTISTVDLKSNAAISSEQSSNPKNTDLHETDDTEEILDVKVSNIDSLDMLDDLLPFEDTPRFNDKWIYQHEVLGMLSLGTMEEILDVQRKKLNLLPDEIAEDAFGCEAMWYMGVAENIKELGLEVPEERLSKMLMIARTSFEVLYEKDPENSIALKGLASCYAKEGNYEKSYVYLQELMQKEDGSQQFTLNTQLATARVLRLLGGQENEVKAQALYSQILGGQLKQVTYDAIKTEISNPPVDLGSGLGLYNISGASFGSAVGGLGVVSHMEGPFRNRLQEVLSAPLPAEGAYDSGWVGSMPVLMPVGQLMTRVQETQGFSKDPQTRLYYSSILSRVSPSNPLSLVGLGQCLQENNQIAESEEYFNKALVEAKKYELLLPDDGYKKLINYITLRKAVNASIMQRPEESDSLFKQVEGFEDGRFTVLTSQLRRWGGL